jgi:hypothetical protein
VEKTRGVSVSPIRLAKRRKYREESCAAHQKSNTPAKNMQHFRVHHLRKGVLFMGCLILCLLAACSSPFASGGSGTNATSENAAVAALLEKNLIVNGDAEGSPGVANDAQIATSLPGWQKDGVFNVVRYGAMGGFPTMNDPGPAKRGQNFFAGGPARGADGQQMGGAMTSATQTIDLTPLATLADSGTISYALGGYFGGANARGDNATLTMRFLDLYQKEVGKVEIGGVSASDRQEKTALLERQNAGKIPKKTITIKLTLTMVRKDDGYNNGYADNLSLSLKH